MYLVHTFYKLPPSKHLWQDLSGLKAFLDKMLRAKPLDIKFDPKVDLEPSVRIHKIDIEKCQEWQSLFLERPGFNWMDMYPEYKKPASP